VAINEIVLIRHGATDWSESGRHTGITDLPLNDTGLAEATALCDRCKEWNFSLVLSSPLQRAFATAHACGLGDRAKLDDDLHEWNYGDYEGVTTADIRKDQPGWTVWNGSCPNGETVDEVGARADRVIARVSDVEGAVALFGHAHMFRIVIARWLGLPPADGRLFKLETASISVLGYERETRVLARLNS
jgi:broad specificity phosphatase PhoE